jgi:hypothetical protein
MSGNTLQAGYHKGARCYPQQHGRARCCCPQHRSSELFQPIFLSRKDERIGKHSSRRKERVTLIDKSIIQNFLSSLTPSSFQPIFPF